MTTTARETDRTAAYEPMPQKPAGIRELTPRSVTCGLIVAAIMGASYPYIVLKLGFGPNVSVVSAFFGYLALGIAFKDYNRWENNIVQTAGTAAAQTAFMCILLAAFDMLSASPTANFHITLSPLHAFWWLAIGGLLGVLLAIPMRQHFVVDERLPFPDGTAAGTTLMVLDAADEGAKRAARALAVGVIASAALMLMTEDARVLSWFPSVTTVGIAVLATTGVGVNWSLLSLGSGIIIGLRVDVSMLLGAALSWVVAPYALLHYGILNSDFTRNDVLFWIMWPATGMLVCAGMAGLLIRWGVLKKTFSNLAGAAADSGAVPMKWVGIGVAITSVALIAVMKAYFDIAIWITALSIILSVPLMLVGLRVLGETNWGPISALSNLMQGIFGAIVPGNIAVNMVASGNTGIIASDSEALMQDYRAGFMIGSTPKKMAIMQLIATPVGAAAVAWMYPLLRSTYGILGSNAGLTSPTSRRWAGFAEILSHGTSALPHGAVTALIIGSLVGILLAIIEARGIRWVPSPTGVGIGMLVPFAVVLVMFLGGVVDTVWRRRNAGTHERYSIPLASGLIAGEALVAVVIPLLVAIGIVH
ncbi:MAG TPA: OPT family oligopeptide transporter [Gemmatimonadaceae bacterium]|nr:OPT family oligopeptide transporter [Gemmatimonadaceae bacterium]